MGVQALMSGDVGDYGQWTTVGYVYNSMTDCAHTGLRSFAMGYSGQPGTHTKSVPGSLTKFVRVAWRCNVNRSFTLGFGEVGITHCQVVLDAPNSRLIGYNAAGGVAGIVNFPSRPVGSWFVLEVKAVIANGTDGILQAKLDGQLILDLSGLDTANNGTPTCSILTFTGGDGSFIDDICIRDDAWPGQHGIYVLKPNGAGSNSAWTPSAGTAVVCVNEAPPEYVTDYLYADGGTPGTKHDFAIAALPISPSSLGAVGIIVNAKLHAAGSGNIRAYGISDSVESDGEDKAQGTSPTYAECLMTVDPSGGGAWTAARVNALLPGVETRT